MTKLFSLLSILSLSAATFALPSAQDAVQMIIGMGMSVEASDHESMLNASMVDAWANEVVSVHNFYRAQYGASAVTWAPDLYAGTLAWAQQCQFHHSAGGGKYGENLFAGTGNTGLAQGVKSWMDEAAHYDWNHPGFSSATGHFTQVVWKGSKHVACALANCRGGTIFPQESKYLVCRYSPAGNVIGYFPENVGRHV